MLESERICMSSALFKTGSFDKLVSMDSNSSLNLDKSVCGGR